MKRRVQDDGLLDLDNQFCFALYAATRGVVRAYTQVLKSIDLTYPQYLVMLVLWEWARRGHGRPTVKALGDRLDLDSGTLTPLLRRLEGKGLITRRRDSPDDREVFVCVTHAGAQLKRRARSVPLKMLERSPISIEDLGQLRDQLKRFRSADAA